MRRAVILGLAFLLGLLAGPGELLAAPINVTLTVDLAFGTLANSFTQSGTVAVNANTGAKTVTGGVADLGGAHARADFLIQGDSNTAFILTLPPSVTLNAVSGPESMTLDTFVSNPASTGVLPGNGQTDVLVGAALHLATGQSPDNYSGTFDVIIEYQ